VCLLNADLGPGWVDHNRIIQEKSASIRISQHNWLFHSIINTPCNKVNRSPTHQSCHWPLNYPSVKSPQHKTYQLYKIWHLQIAKRHRTAYLQNSIQLRRNSTILKLETPSAVARIGPRGERMLRPHVDDDEYWEQVGSLFNCQC